MNDSTKNNLNTVAIIISILAIIISIFNWVYWSNRPKTNYEPQHQGILIPAGESVQFGFTIPEEFGNINGSINGEVTITAHLNCECGQEIPYSKTLDYTGQEPLDIAPDKSLTCPNCGKVH